MSDAWYVLDERGRLGPFTKENLLFTLNTFQDPPEVLVKREFDKNYRRAGDIEELQPRTVAMPPTQIISHLTKEPVLTPELTGSAMFRWAKKGAAVGLVLGILAGLAQLTKGIPNGISVAYEIGQFIGYVLICSFLGFFAGAIRDFFKRSSASPVISADIPERVRSWNVIKMHWRGQYPLWVSYWVISFFVSIIAAAFVGAVASVFTISSGYQPVHIFAFFLIVYLGVALLGVWQIGGLWSAANNQIASRAARGKKAPWAGLAKLAAIFITLQYAAVFLRDAYPQIRESWRMAFMGDPDMPDYTMRIMRNGTEVEIVGGFKYGLTDDFQKLLRASQQVRVVHLDSLGGRIGEAKRLYEVIKKTGLTTYVSNKCVSACTLAFAAGRERYIAKGASLAFHGPAFPGMDKEALKDSIDDQTRLFKLSGFDVDFVRKALNTPNAEFWKPTVSELIKANAITGVSDGSQFSSSGFGKLTKEKLGAQLAKSASLFEAIQGKFPQFYAELLDIYYGSYQAGETEAQSVEKLRGKLLPFIEQLKPLASNDALQDLAKLIADQLTALNVNSPRLCYEMAQSTSTTAAYLDRLPASYKARELELNEKIIRSAMRRPLVDQNAADALYKKVVANMKLLRIADADFDTFASGNAAATTYDSYCRGAVGFFRSVAMLPLEESGSVMRQLLTQK